MLSGNLLFVIDPLNKFNSLDEDNETEAGTKTNGNSSGTTKNKNGIIKAYQYSTLLRRFPHMFVPFFYNNEKGYDGTLVRVPFRTCSSEISNTIVGSNDIKHLLGTVERDLSSTMVYGVYLNQCSISTIGRTASVVVAGMRGQLTDVCKHLDSGNSGSGGSGAVTHGGAAAATAMEAPLFSCRIEDCKERVEIEENTKWHKGGLSRFFSGGSASVSLSYKLVMHCTGNRFVCSKESKTLGSELDYHEKEVWLVLSNLGTGETREIAVSTEMDVLRRNEDPSISLAPVLGLACRLEGRGERSTKGGSERSERRPQSVVGRFCSGSAVGARCGLPYMIHGRFEFNPTNGVPHKNDAPGTAAPPKLTASNFAANLNTINAMKTKWNQALMDELFGSSESSVVVQLLLWLKKEHSRTNTPNEFYKNWPTMRSNVVAADTSSPQIVSSIQLLMDRISTVTLFQTLSKYKLYWSSTKRTWNTLNDGILPNKQCTPRVIAYAETSFAMLSLPPTASADFQHAGVTIKSLTPAQMRRHLMQEKNPISTNRAEAVAHKLQQQEPGLQARPALPHGETKNGASASTHITSAVTDHVAVLASELIAFCLSDLSLSDANMIASEVGRALGGLRLVPTGSNTLACLPRERQRLPLDEVLVLTQDMRQRCLLPTQTLVHESLLATLKEQIPRLQFGQDGVDEGTKQKQLALFHSLGICTFEAGVLAAHISKILPSEWKNQLIVRWDPAAHANEPSLGWMKMFWSEISINDVNQVRLFDAWPLVPLKNMELMSCSLMECGLITKESENEGTRKSAEEEERVLLGGVAGGGGGKEGGSGGERKTNGGDSRGLSRDFSLEAEVSF